MADPRGLAAAGRPTEDMLKSLREATAPNLPRARAVALLQRGRGDLQWAVHMYWEAAEEEEANDPEEDEEEDDDDDEGEGALGADPYADLDAFGGGGTPVQNAGVGGLPNWNDAGVGGLAGALGAGGWVGAAAAGGGGGGAAAAGGQPAPQPVQLPQAVHPSTITAAQIRALQDVTKENLSDEQMRALLAKSGGHVNIAVELYFNSFDMVQNDLRKRGLPVHTDRS